MKRLSLLFLFASPLFAQSTITAVDCTAAQVQAAFNLVSASTTLVIIPACSGGVNWTGQVTLNIPNGNTSLTVQGAGSQTTTGGGDQTVIVDAYASSQALLLIFTNSAHSSFFRMTGITIQGGSNGGAANTKNNGVTGIAGGSHNIRIDHMHFSDDTYSGPGMESATNLTFFGDNLGVVDHSIFDDTTNGGQGIRFYQGTLFNDTADEGDVSWNTATGLGTVNAIYAEYDNFNGGVADDCVLGGRMVFRHDNFTNTSVQTHPTGSQGRARGCRMWEVYDNAFTAPLGQGNGFFMSSGTGVVWNNTVDSHYTSFVTIHSMRSDNVTYMQTAPPNGWGYCGTQVDGSGPSGWDQNTSSVTGYRCLDQPGSGVGDLLTGQFPPVGGSGVCNQTLGCSTINGQWPREVLEPVYEWLDTSSAGKFWSVSDAADLATNRDYYLWCNASSSTGCTSAFNGTVGTGSGLLASRPATCTPLTGYWATDTSTFYQCPTTNTWVTYYTPFTDPHPLDTSPTQTGTPVISPAAGSYTSPQTVSITTSTAGATICWTNNGTTPTADGAGTCIIGTTYSGSFSQTIVACPSGSTVKAIASKSGLSDSLVATNTYCLSNPPPVNVPAPASGVVFIGQNNPQPGNWQGIYGKDGYIIPGVSQSLPAYATVSVTNANTYAWTLSTSDGRALQWNNTRIAPCWYGQNYSFDVNFTDGKTHVYTVYALDWDSFARSETFTLTDISGKILDKRSVSGFNGGTYLQWNVTGHIRVNVSCTGGANAVVSAQFFG